MSDEKKKEEAKYLFNVPKSDFSRWYEEILEKADIIDKRYPVKGMLVWKPYGFKALKLMRRIMEELLDKYGHQEAYFPALIPEEVFEKERDFLEGFSGETFVVEGTLTKKLGRRLLLRPTSETVMYYMFSQWITSHRDLPLKIYQTVNVFRYETEHTRPIIRVREIMNFIEAHTAHATPEEAEAQIKEGIQIYKKFFDRLCLAYVILRTPKWDTFAGAEYNYDFFTLMPDGRAIEMGSVINLGQKFAKAFDIKYMKPDGTYEYVYQTCYGVSERALAITISIHGDDRGIIFPSEIAPIQVIIVPVIFKGEQEDVMKKCLRLRDELSKHFRVEVDLSEKTPGYKYYYWEMKGVPVRLEIGPREVKNYEVTVVRRDTGEKRRVPDSALVEEIKRTLEDIDRNLRKKAEEFLMSSIREVSSLEEVLAHMNGTLIKVPWCGDDNCGMKIEERTGLKALGYDPEEECKRDCVICRRPGKYYLWIGNKY